MSTLIERMLKASTVKETALIKESKVFGKKESIPTSVPMVNVALSGKIDGGLLPGLLMLAGPSKHFKSAFALMMAASFQKKYPEGVVLFYDSEFGSPESYFESFGMDMDRVIHTPLTDIEVLKFDIMKQLGELSASDDVMILIDSLGNLASKKEVEDALDGKSVADMSRAKQNKSLGRMVTPHLNLKNIPMVVVNHTYKEIGLYPKDVVGGGTGLYYSSDAVWIIGRRQEKVGTDVTGYHFVINIDKSRHVKEKSAIPITVTFEGGIAKWSGLLEVALAGGYMTKPKVGWYQAIDPSTGEVLTDKLMRAKEVESSGELWEMIFDKTNFAEFIEHRYKVAGGNLMQDPSIAQLPEDLEDAVEE